MFVQPGFVRILFLPSRYYSSDNFYTELKYIKQTKNNIKLKYGLDFNEDSEILDIIESTSDSNNVKIKLIDEGKNEEGNIRCLQYLLHDIIIFVTLINSSPNDKFEDPASWWESALHEDEKLKVEKAFGDCKILNSIYESESDLTNFSKTQLFKNQYRYDVRDVEISDQNSLLYSLGNDSYIHLFTEKHTKRSMFFLNNILYEKYHIYKIETIYNQFELIFNIVQKKQPQIDEFRAQYKFSTLDNLNSNELYRMKNSFHCFLYYLGVLDDFAKSLKGNYDNFESWLSKRSVNLIHEKDIVAYKKQVAFADQKSNEYAKKYGTDINEYFDKNQIPIEKLEENNICSVNIHQINVSRLSINKDENDYYTYILENELHKTYSFRDRKKIQIGPRDRIIKKLSNLHSFPSNQMGISFNSEINNCNPPTVEDIGSSIYKHLLSSPCQDHILEINSEFVILTIDDIEIPWELMCYSNNYFCLKHSIGRKLQTNMPPSLPKKEKCKDVLSALFIANPRNDLPGSQKEVCAIIKNLNSGLIKCEYLIGKDANYTLLFDKLQNQEFDLIHYSGHAVFNQENPEESYLQLSNDKWVTARELADELRHSPPKFVFINACDSARGNYLEYQKHQNKINGLASAFLSIGTESYIGTLWPVHDQIAAEFGISLYDSILNGDPIGLAVKNAKLKMFNKKDKKSPTWASFVLYGDPTVPIVNKKNSIQ